MTSRARVQLGLTLALAFASLGPAARAAEPVAAAVDRPAFVVIPYVGGAAALQEGGRGNGSAFRGGLLLGAHVREKVSLNLSVMVEHTPANPGYYLSHVFNLGIETAFAPLLHQPFGGGEAVLGPKLGGYAMAAREWGYGSSTDWREYGAAIGADAGIFFGTGLGASIGALASLEVRAPIEACRTDPAAGGGRDCSARFDPLVLAGMGLALSF